MDALSKSYFESFDEDIAFHTPKKGYRLVFIDDWNFDDIGEQLESVALFDKYSEAENAMNALAKTDEGKKHFMILPPRRQDDAEEAAMSPEECDWKTIRGTPICIKHGETPSDALARVHPLKNIKFKTKALPAEPKDPKRKPQVEYTEALNGYHKFLQDTKRENYSYDPVTRKAYDAFTKEEASSVYQQFADGENPLYFVGTTNHQGDPTHESESEYNQVQGQNRHVFFGRWVNEKGVIYSDIAFSINHGTTDEDAVKLKKHYAQESVLKISADGSIDFI